MYIIYYGFGNNPLPSISTFLHLDEKNTIPSWEYFIDKGPDLYDLERKAIGRLIFIGEDTKGHQIFLLNVASAESIILPALSSVMEISQMDQSQLLFVDITQISHPLLTIGFFLSGFPLLTKLGLSFSKIGLKNTYPKISKIVDDTKKRLI